MCVEGRQAGRREGGKEGRKGGKNGDLSLDVVLLLQPTKARWNHFWCSSKIFSVLLKCVFRGSVLRTMSKIYWLVEKKSHKTMFMKQFYFWKVDK